jgi:hypothetical protein
MATTRLPAAASSGAEPLIAGPRSCVLPIGVSIGLDRVEHVGVAGRAACPREDGAFVRGHDCRGGQPFAELCWRSEGIGGSSLRGVPEFAIPEGLIAVVAVRLDGRRPCGEGRTGSWNGNNWRGVGELAAGGRTRKRLAGSKVGAEADDPLASRGNPRFSQAGSKQMS